MKKNSYSIEIALTGKKEIVLAPETETSDGVRRSTATSLGIRCVFLTTPCSANRNSIRRSVTCPNSSIQAKYTSQLSKPLGANEMLVPLVKLC